MSDSVTVWRPSTDPEWMCTDHGLARVLSAPPTIIGQLLGTIPQFPTFEDFAAWSEARLGVKFEQSTSDVNPCFKCQRVEQELQAMVSEPAQE
jgi:hypothetical protein